MTLRINRGFTLLELIIVMMIVSILAALAIPNYRKYLIRNAEKEVQARLESLKVQAEKWKAKSLSYKGFNPSNLSTDNYTITIRDGDDSTKQLTDTSGSDAVAGKKWVALAVPIQSDYRGGKFLFFSNGSNCKVAYNQSLEISNNCNGKEEWR